MLRQSNKFEGATPGPWFVGTQNDALYIINTPPRPAPNDYITPGSPDTLLIASLYVLPSHAEDANAALIAAAPTLLAQRDALADALRALLPPERGIHGGPLVCGVWRYEDGTDENSARHKGQIAPHTVAKARAALALLETEK